MSGVLLNNHPGALTATSLATADWLVDRRRWPGHPAIDQVLVETVLFIGMLSIVVVLGTAALLVSLSGARMGVILDAADAIPSDDPYRPTNGPSGDDPYRATNTVSWHYHR